MRALASFVMAGRSQAVMVVAATGMLSLLIWPLSVLSSAAVALVTLRLGERDGMLTVALASAVCGVLGLIALGSGGVVFMYLVLLFWLPVWMLAVLLRNTRSLSLAAQAALIVGVAVIVLAYWQSPDPTMEARRLLEALTAQSAQSPLLDEQTRAELIDSLAPRAVGMVAEGFYLVLTLSLFLGRWWQALLYNPGGFRQEFHALRTSKLLGYLALGLLLAQFALGVDWGWVRYLLMLLVGLYFLQGLAISHAMVAQAGANPAWLVGLYVLVIAVPYATNALAATGLADTWLDFRARSRSRRGGGPDAGPNE